MSLYSRQLAWSASRQKIGADKPSGALLSLFNERDTPTFHVSYVYAITIPKGGLKGPYSHLLRTTICTVLYGSIEIVYRNKPTASFARFPMSADAPVQVVIPPETPFCLVGTSAEPAVVVNVCDFPWSPDSSECSVPEFDCEYIAELLK